MPAATPARRLPAWLPLLVFMILGAGARVSTTVFDPMIYPDSTQYLALAREIGSGAILGRDYPLEDGFGSARKVPPLYSLLIAPWVGVGLDPEHVGAAVSIVMSVLLFIPLFFTAQILFGRRAALMAGGLFVIHPFTLRYAGAVLTDAAFAALFMALIWAATLLLKRPTAARAAAAGALAALLSLTRDVGLAVLPLILAAASLKSVALDRRGWRLPARQGAIFLAAFLVVSLPWLAHIRARTGHFGLTIRMGNVEIIRHVLSPGPAKSGGSDAEGEGAFVDAPARSLPVRAAGNFLANGVELVRAWTPAVAALVLGFIGLSIAAVRRRCREFFKLIWLPAWVALLWATYSLLTAMPDDPRYLYPLMGPGLILAAAAADQAAERLSARFQRAGFWSAGRIQLAVAGGLCLAVFVNEVPGLIQQIKFQSAERRFDKFAYGSREAAADLNAAGLVPPGAVVMDRKPFIPYYLSAHWYFDHRRAVVMPRTVAGIEEILAGRKADFVVANSFTFGVLEPRLLGLAFALPSLPNCRVAYSRYFEEYQRVITVYKVGEAEPPLPPLAPAEALGRAQEFFARGNLIFAFRLADQAVTVAPDNAPAWELKTRVLSRFYECAKIDDATPTLAFVPGLLPALEDSAAHYVRLQPNDQAARQAWLNIRGTLVREKAMMAQPEWKDYQRSEK